MLPILYNLKKTIATIYTPKNLVLQILACIITYLIVISGFDWFYFKMIQVSMLKPYLSPAVVIGGILPLFGLPLLCLYAKISKQNNLLKIVWSLSQSAGLAWCISSLYKAFTGRVQPLKTFTSTTLDASRNWNFGFLEHGIFWGWPSSHTTVAFAMAFTLIALYPTRRTVLVLALCYASYISAGVSVDIHWISECVAGVIFGTIIGSAVGRSFYQKN